ncbi:2-oxo acid dehydrogenase subunit E2 [Halolamina sediminis]|uniref:2-oxo acid dehydrogenase subunit E2 n=1 Tax=Halolamina sediminis TaxID=1480675 RepID=UPI0006B660B9|nr:2-oxo acid dehydrogenase subunit E2 [Halolamina sediminis]
MTVKEFKLPDVGEGVAEGELVSWQVSPGDTVSEGDIVAEVETDKALVEVPSRYDGTVQELFAEEGEMVPVGDVIISFDVDDGVESGDAEAEAPDTEGEPGESTDEAKTDTEEAATAETPDGRVFAPPSARKLARELGVEITDVEGSGPGGRISEEDVRSYHEAAETHDETADETPVTPGEEEAPTPSSGAGASGTVSASDSPEAMRETTLATPATRALAKELGVDLDTVPTEKTRDGEAYVEKEDVRAFAEREEEEAGTEAGESATAEPAREETVPYRGVRRTIGEQMATSKYTAPHVSHHDTAEIDELVETREELKQTAEEKGVRLTYMAFVLKAVVAGLKEYPILNSELDEEEGVIRLKNYYNIGIAVATDAGLMVPVVKNVDEKGLLEIADEVQELATKARERTISPQEMQGGTFSITNFGAFGGEYATPIINYPETAILGLGAIEQRPVVEDGEVVAAHTLPLSLAIDHRVIDGAEAAKFTNTVKEYLAEPTKLLL